MQRRVFVTGGTGFVGRAVVRALLSGGHHIRILARNPCALRKINPFASGSIELWHGDILKPSTIEGAMNQIDAVVHLVGIISEVGNVTFENLHSRATKTMTKIARDAGIRRFIHMSALGTRPGAVSHYHQTKWAAEEVVRTSGLDYTIFRPSLVYGPEDHFVNLFAQIIRRSPFVPLLGRPTALFQPVPVDCVARAFERALAAQTSTGQVYDLCGPERLTLEAMMKQIIATMGRRRILVRIPQRLARLQARLLEWLYPVLFNKASPLSRDQLVMLQEDNIGNGEAAEAAFGFRASSFQEGIKSYLAP